MEPNAGDGSAGQPTEGPSELRYMDPATDELARNERVAAQVAGALASAATVLVAMFFLLFLSMSFAGGAPAATPRERLVIVAPLPIALVAVTCYQHFYRRRRGFLAGVLIGIGIAALIEGACLMKYR